MRTDNLSYSEAYTLFIEYCSEKEDKDFGEIVKIFSENGVEQEFKQMYDSGEHIKKYSYYRKLKRSNLV